MNTASFIESIAPCVFRAAQPFYAIGQGYRYNAITRSVEPDPGSLIPPVRLGRRQRGAIGRKAEKELRRRERSAW